MGNLKGEPAGEPAGEREWCLYRIDLGPEFGLREQLLEELAHDRRVGARTNLAHDRPGEEA